MWLKGLLLGTATGTSPRADAGLAIYRVVAGLSVALLHGVGKVPPSDRFVERVAAMGFSAPEAFAWLAAFAELGGGLLLAAGLLTRPAAFLLLGQFAVVVLLANAGDPLEEQEVPLLFLASALMFLLTGAGRYSIDGLLARDP